MGEPNDLTGVVMVSMDYARVVTIKARKSDRSGWWVHGGGGLCNEVIADGRWRPLRVVLAEHAMWDPDRLTPAWSPYRTREATMAIEPDAFACAYCERTDRRPMTFTGSGLFNIDGVILAGQVCQQCWVAADHNARNLPRPRRDKGGSDRDE